MKFYIKENKGEFGKWQKTMKRRTDMRVIISPAKKMRVDRDSFPVRDLPALLPKAEALTEQLRSMPYEDLKALWKCNDRIAALNTERLRSMDLRHGLTPAILAYDGIQYQ